MDLSTVHHGITKRPQKKRVGRGVGSGHGKTASRGSKGQYASAGAKMFQWTFEGGQMPLFRRIPKRGFSHGSWDRPVHIINVGDLDAVCEDGGSVDLAWLKEQGYLKGSAEILRVLGDGDLTKKLTIRAHHFTKTALEKIQGKGGTAEVIPPPKKPVKNKMKPRKAK